MLAAFEDFVDHLLGLNVDVGDLDFSQMACRTLVVFTWALLLARLADRRLLGHIAGFDIVVLVVLGSVLSRGINGQAAFFPTLGASALLVGLHHVVATVALHSHRFSCLVKGKPKVLVRDGRVDEDALRATKITRDDLEENLRLHGGVTDLARVAEARLERNGSVSVVKKQDR